MTDFASTGLLPRLTLDCEQDLSATPVSNTAWTADLAPSLAVANSSDPVTAVDNLFESMHERYGFGDVARLFQRLSEAAS
ncbi:MAG: hypothetical protein K2X77_32610 [Candidatus Obscuribacterales bacterium]|jgi:hypothetical protein|nr:hypothetical protein [Candidatus Obscuribacterales bacterium]